MKKSAKKIDKIVTWLIIWTAIASMIWLSQTKKWKEITNDLKEKSLELKDEVVKKTEKTKEELEKKSKKLWKNLKEKKDWFFSKVNKNFWKIMLFFIKIFNKKDKKLWEK